MPDKYDKAIAYLTEHPEDILDAWGVPDPYTPEEIKQAHCLFSYATPSGDYEDVDDECELGCLTQIRACPEMVASTKTLTAAIRADNRIPV